MNRIVKTIFAATMILWAGLQAIAQQIPPEENPIYGKTPEERKKNLAKLNFLSDEYRAKNYNDAAVFLKDLMNDAPQSSSNLYLWGATIYKDKFNKASSPEQKKIYLDSVLLIYDRRAEYYGSHPTRGLPYILAMKARDYATLAPMDRAGVRNNFRVAVDASADNPDGVLLTQYFQQLVTDAKGFDIQPEELIAEYERLTPMVEKVSSEDRDKFNSLFAGSGVASCEVLEKTYSKAIAAKPGDVDLLAKTYSLMSMINCQSDFYISVAEKYYAAKPTSAVAIRLASVFESRQEFSKALKYLGEMLPAETDPVAKSNLYVRIAASELGLKHASAAASAARSAIALSPGNGYAHMFLAESYVAGGGCSGFAAQTVYWLAYDEFARARSEFAGEASQVSMIDNRMALCRANFPTFEDAFMYVKDYKDGMSYHVSCGWISGTTTTRSR